MTNLRPLLERLKTYTVDWKFSFVPAEDVVYEPGIDREEAELTKANVVSSELRPLWNIEPRHVVALDIDYPAHLIESSTNGHYHLYLDVPGGVAHEDYMELLALLGRIGVIEKGYAEVSIKRGHSDLRLPWIHKANQVLSETNALLDGQSDTFEELASSWPPNQVVRAASPLTDVLNPLPF